MNINFITISPTPHYNDVIGGSMVCHNLAHNLSILGECSYLYANSTKSNYTSNLIPWGTIGEFDQENTIVIYPSGNGEHTYINNVEKSWIKADNKVRWLMNNQGTEYPQNDKLYKFVDYFETLDTQKIDGNLLAIDVDLNKFKNQNLQRSGICYYTKGEIINNETRLHNIGDLCIDNYMSLPSPSHREDYLISTFNKCEKFICYSNKSFIATLAALCGCIVVVATSKGLERKDWYNGFPTLKYGIAYGEDDKTWAVETLPLVKDHVLDLKRYSLQQTKTFIKDCYEWLTIKYN
tara:strand:- start:973 stop:1851 length:879 start_codon:yes stop_codon:yes gene_type:complete